jgi:cytochrome c5
LLGNELRKAEWLKHFNLLVGGKRQTPISIALARKNSSYFRATLDRLDNVAKFFVAAAKPQPLAKAPDGEQYLNDSAPMVARGQQVFAANCAACHVSNNKMPAPPAGVTHGTPAWDAWTRSDDFKSKMTTAVRATDFLSNNYLSTDRPYSVSRIGTNACAAAASNAMRGHIWDNFSSETYKQRAPGGTIGILDPFTGAIRPFALPDGGRGYQRVPSLVSIWASAPYLHNSSVGQFTGDPSVAGRMKAFEDGMEKLLWPNKRSGLASVYRTTQTSWLYIEKSYVPAPLFLALKAKGLGMPGKGNVLQIGPIPKGTPVNLIANIDLEPTLNPAKLIDFLAAAVKLNAAFHDIRDKKLDEAAAAARLQELAPALLKLSKCPDLVTDHGHLFGTALPDTDKRALIAYLKRL